MDVAAPPLGGRGGRKPRDLTAARADIAGLLHDRQHDDGSYGPLFIRLAWHLSGTYDKHSNTGTVCGVCVIVPMISESLESSSKQHA